MRSGWPCALLVFFVCTTASALPAVLVYGEPGTGKSTVANALASYPELELSSPFLTCGPAAGRCTTETTVSKNAALGWAVVDTAYEANVTRLVDALVAQQLAVAAVVLVVESRLPQLLHNLIVALRLWEVQFFIFGTQGKASFKAGEIKMAYGLKRDVLIDGCCLHPVENCSTCLREFRARVFPAIQTSLGGSSLTQPPSPVDARNWFGSAEFLATMSAVAILSFFAIRTIWQQEERLKVLEDTGQKRVIALEDAGHQQEERLTALEDAGRQQNKRLKAIEHSLEKALHKLQELEERVRTLEASERPPTRPASQQSRSRSAVNKAK